MYGENWGFNGELSIIWGNYNIFCEYKYLSSCLIPIVSFFLHIFLTISLKNFSKNPLTLWGNRTILILLALDMIEC